MGFHKTTELEAINTILSIIGEAPINSMSSSLSSLDVKLAKTCFQEAALTVYAEGWHFNTEQDYVAMPDIIDHKIPIPPNALAVDTMGADADKNVTIRARYLYDLDNHTFIFTEPTITLEVTFILDFEDIPQQARTYITLLAGVLFQQRSLGSQTIDSFAERRIMEARIGLMRLEEEQSDLNILTADNNMYSILRRG